MRAMVREELVTRHGFSVDGFNARTVESLRVNAKLDVILENIRMLIRVRDYEQKVLPTIVIRYALMRSNVEELPTAVHQWGKMGINAIDCGYLSLCNGIDRQESLYFHQELMEEVFKEARRVASEYPNLKLNLPPLIEDEKVKQLSPQKCLAPWRFVMIDTNGQVLPCYRAFEIFHMGKVYDEDGLPVRDVWNSAEYEMLRRTVNNDAVKKHYSYCGRCEYRYGYGHIASHLGDETWVDALKTDNPEVVHIDHRR